MNSFEFNKLIKVLKNKIKFLFEIFLQVLTANYLLSDNQ